MRLLFINHRDIFHPQAGGAEQVIYEVGKRLVKEGIEVYWMSENKGHAEGEVDGIRLIRKGNPLSLHYYSLREAGKYDVVIDSIAHAVPFFSYKVNRKTIGLIHHVHQDVVDFELNPVLSRIVKHLEKGVKNYRNLISVSNTTKKELIKRFGIDEDKIRVIYNGIDHEKFKPGEKSEYPLVLWIGRLKKYKNPLDAIKIFKRLKNRKAILTIVGTGEMEDEVKRAISGEKNIFFLGRVEEGKKINLYQKAWVVLSTSFIEGWGMTVVEANSCGTPAVAYSKGSLPEIIQDGVNGFLVEYKNYDKAAEDIDYIIEDENTMRYFSKLSYESSLRYDWNKTSEEYYKYIWEISAD
ncbi:glycosyltransferase family 4 protein [Stygiolobus caldivivus]|uniref:Glycosyl transferase n=1 Tax=Stygiolobus caldivivus TaxID=2824673 RepID=A0A8D5U779_9CREN|nr:glycosyltransferase family 4 protein [Stygiolobus caldivivus]BCU70267.1 glycosyl transferase [Stygiolobus caldivivus]